MKAPEKPKSPKAREAEAVAHIVTLIRARVRDLRLSGDQSYEVSNQLDEETAAALRKIGQTADTIHEYGQEFATALQVRSDVNFLQELFAAFDDQSPWGKAATNKRLLNTIATRVGALREALYHLPPAVRCLLFRVEHDGADLMERLSGYERAAKNSDEFIDSLQDLNVRVAELIDMKPGERGGAKFRQRIVATFAARLCKLHDIKSTRGNEDKPSLFEQVATSLYEAATGETDANLARACRDIIDREIVV